MFWGEVNHFGHDTLKRSTNQRTDIYSFNDARINNSIQREMEFNPESREMWSGISRRMKIFEGISVLGYR